MMAQVVPQNVNLIVPWAVRTGETEVVMKRRRRMVTGEEQGDLNGVSLQGMDQAFYWTLKVIILLIVTLNM